MILDVNKKYKTVGGNIVIFNDILSSEVDDVLSRVNNGRVNNVRMHSEAATRTNPDKIYCGALITKTNERHTMCWNEDGNIIPKSIPFPLLRPAFTKEEVAKNIESFNLVEYEHIDITKYFKDRAENFNKLVLDYKDAHNVLYNVAKGICTNATSKELVEKINKYDNLAKEIISILERDIDAVSDMETVDAILLYTVENELKKFTASVETFNSGYLNAIKLSIASDVYGYVPVENNNHIKIIPMVMTDGSVKLFGQDGKEIKTDEDAQ